MTRAEHIWATAYAQALTARVVRLLELGEIATDDEGGRGPALNTASLSHARIEAAKVAQIVADASEGAV